MRNIIVVGDIHAKNKEPYWFHIQKMFDELIKKYSKDVLILLGDVFDSSSPVAEIEETIAYYLSQFSEVHIVSGNHDQSRRLGNTLLPLRVHNNIHVYVDAAEIEIEGKKCLILPYKDGYKEYESISFIGDYCFAHITNVEDAFSDEGIDLKNVNALQVYGHTHTNKEYKNKIVLGVPLPTRNLEISNPIMIIEENGHSFVSLDHNFSIDKIEYGTYPENKTNLYNVINAPSKDLVFESYKGYYIREEGIEILRNENDLETEELTSFENGNLLEKFNLFAKENDISKEVLTCVSSRLSKIS